MANTPKSNGGKIRRAASRQFEAERGELSSVSVPEWVDESGEPVKVYYRKRLTIRDLRDVNHQLTMLGTDAASPLLMACALFRVCALDDGGQRIFATGEDAEKFEKSVDPMVVADLVERMGLGEAMFSQPEGDPGEDLDPTQGISSQ